MRKATTLLLTAILACSLCACSGKPAPQQTAPVAETTPAQQETVATTEQAGEVALTGDITVDEMFGYRYSIPYKFGTSSVSSGALADTDQWDMYIYGLDYLEFTSWDDVVEQCKKEVSSAIFSATSYLPSEQTSTADTPFINEHGVEMMRVTGELSGNDGTKPYIAYYYITNENYVRFIIALNFENEADAADAIDFVAERLEKGEN